LPITAQN